MRWARAKAGVIQVGATGAEVAGRDRHDWNRTGFEKKI